MHQYQDLIEIFNSCFSKDYNTQLVKGEDEPLYLPADESCSYHRIFFAHGFFASALHECSHWLIAGEERRKLVDFGYWYAPDGRTQEQQALFQKVEVKPQALEWILSKAAGHRFRVSLDNLNGEPVDATVFKKAVYEQVRLYCENGISDRVQTFRLALSHFYNQNPSLVFEDFSYEELDAF